MAQPAAAIEVDRSPDSLEREIRARIGSLSYLPTTVAVAMKFVRLGKDPDADASEYAKVISADASLSSKLLALSNSSWAGVRNKVSNVKMAVNLLGLGTVRTLAISYCMTGLHNELRLSPQESQSFWESSVAKAVSARKYTGILNAKLTDEAFVAGLFEDLALTVMYSVVREPYMAVLHDPQSSTRVQMERERAMFGMDHTEVGRLLAQKLELPDAFIDMIAFHHNLERLEEFIDEPALRDATYVAGLLPHALNAWNQEDAELLAEFLTKRMPGVGVSSFVADVQAEFIELYTFFNACDAPEAQLPELLAAAAREAADNTTMLVGRVAEFVQRAAENGGDLSKLGEPAPADVSATELDGALERAAFLTRAEENLAAAARRGKGFALCILGVDNFKTASEMLGQAVGREVLKTVLATLRNALPPQTLIGRFNADEFALLLDNCAEREARAALGEAVLQAAACQTSQSGPAIQATVSAGLLCVRPSNHRHALDVLLMAAQKLMADARTAGGNQAYTRVV
jgi:diguanylate cyclase (GGDEF)-like protein